MKLSIALLAVVIFGVMGYGILQIGQTELVSNLPDTPQVTKLFTISPISGTFLLSTTTDGTVWSEFSPQIKTIKVTEGSKVKTNISSRVKITSSGGHNTFLDYNSEAKLNTDSKKEKRTEILLSSGALWAKPSPFKQQESSILLPKQTLEEDILKEQFEIKTSNASILVQGTSFGVWHSNHTTTIIVTEGKVVVSEINEETGTKIFDSEQEVLAGQKAIMTLGKTKISKLTSSDQSSAWYTYNNPVPIIFDLPVATTSPETSGQ